MDIYEFIPSRDIGAYCRKLGYEFSVLEQAVLIHLSSRPRSEKADAYIDLAHINGIENCMVIDHLSGQPTALLKIIEKTIHLLQHSAAVLGEIQNNDAICPNETDFHLSHFFDWFYIDIPTPFRRGDLLIELYPHSHSEGTILVLDQLTKDLPEYKEHLQKYGDTTDLGGNGYFVSDADGSVIEDHINYYLSLEYCRNPLPASHVKLKAVSEQLKEDDHEK